MKILPSTVIMILLSSWYVSAQCPTMKIVVPKSLSYTGDEMKFVLTEQPEVKGLRYIWSVNNGTIQSGAGTREIVVRTDVNAGVHTLTAKVEVAGLPAGCKNSFSETAPVSPVGVDPVLLDEWVELKPNDQRARLDAVFNELIDNPDNIGVLIVSVKRGERLDAQNSRVQFFLKHIRYRNFDPARIWFALQPGTESRVKVYRLPSSVLEPSLVPCLNCKIIKAADIK